MAYPPKETGPRDAQEGCVAPIVTTTSSIHAALACNSESLLFAVLSIQGSCLSRMKLAGVRASKHQHRHKTCNDPQIKHIHVLYFEGKMQKSKAKLLIIQIMKR